MINIVSLLNKLCIRSLLSGILISGLVIIFISLPANYVVGELNEHSTDITDLKVIISQLPRIQEDISEVKSDLKLLIKENKDDFEKLNLMICQDSKGKTCDLT